MIFYQFIEEFKHRSVISNFNTKEVEGFITDEALMSYRSAVPFVFAPMEKTISVTHIDTTEPADLPFKSVFFELLDGLPMNVFTLKGKTLKTIGLHVYEVSPHEYRFALYLREQDGYDSIMAVYRPDATAEEYEWAVYKYCLQIVKALLERIKTEEVGFHNPRKAIKLRIGGKKEHFRISKVVYVSPKKSVSRVESSTSRQIDWSHRWTVRGHWRKVAAIGKDREGLPISGHTWVRPHEKGPENAPLVPKVRVVLEEKLSTKSPVQ